MCGQVGSWGKGVPTCGERSRHKEIAWRGVAAKGGA